MQVIQQARIRPYVLNFPPFAAAAKFAPFAAKVLASQGVAANASTRDKARAVVGWFAANAVHPQPFLHPNGTTQNTDVLPAGETWATFNAVFGTQARTDSDTAYWYTIFPDGIAMLEALIGTTSGAGVTTDNGMLTEYAANKWRIRSFAAFRSVQCTLQSKMAQVVLAALGILAFDISTVGHDPMAYYDAEDGKWYYIDPTFGEMLKIRGRYATPYDLLRASIEGDSGSITGEKLPGAGYLAVGYFTSPNLQPGGMSYMTIHVDPQWSGGKSDRRPYRFGTLPSQAASDRSGTLDQLMPVLGAAVARLDDRGGTYEICLRSSWPEHAGYQKSVDLGATWAAAPATDYLPVGAPETHYRSVTAAGFYGTPAKVTSL